MAILNYTTTVDVDKTLSEIVGKLARAGAKSISIDYDEQTHAPIALDFVIKTALGNRAFRLPANIDAVWKTMSNQYHAGKIPHRFVTKEQAGRVGWRILKDWVEAQLAIIETQMVPLDEVFLPYMVGDSGQTVYQLYQSNTLALPAGSAEG